MQISSDLPRNNHLATLVQEHMRSLAAAAAIAIACSPTTPTPEPPRPPALDDAAALARAHEFMSALDRRDVAAFRALSTKGFVLFEDGRAKPAEHFVSFWKRAKPAERTRSCKDEVIHRSAGAIVYVGDCAEHQPAYGNRAAEDWQGWNTLVLVPSDGTWKVALWQWGRSGIAAARIRFNDAYRRDTVYTKAPNQLLVDTVADLEPGRALVLTMGQGRNALHLASKGWKVTGVDIAEIGVSKARAAAAERGLEITAVLADIDTYDFGAGRWELVTMLYAGGDPDWIARAKKAIAPGGVFVLEHFSGGLIGFDKGEPAASFADWEIVKSEVVTDVADWGQSKAKLVRLVARKPR